ncbi:hypothetical protein LINPERHAP1_LOCUS31377 [Linum perenne]
MAPAQKPPRIKARIYLLITRMIRVPTRIQTKARTAKKVL